jgi:hypothetical protein
MEERISPATADTAQVCPPGCKNSALSYRETQTAFKLSMPGLHFNTTVLPADFSQYRRTSGLGRRRKGVVNPTVSADLTIPTGRVPFDPGALEFHYVFFFWERGWTGGAECPTHVAPEAFGTGCAELRARRRL